MCFGKCIRGREGQCCIGCSTRLGINLIGLICLFEVGLMGYLLAQGLNLQTIAWFENGMFPVKYGSMRPVLMKQSKRCLRLNSVSGLNSSVG